MLEGVRVIDLSDRLPGAYCTKLLADAGADVVKVEPPTGDPLRRWSVSGMVGSDGDPDGALFRYLATSKRSVVADLTTESGRERVLRLVDGAAFVVETMLPGRIEELGLGPDALWSVDPAVTVVSISPFGRGGPRSAEDCPEFLLQALSGSIAAHGLAGRTPVAVGGRLGEWAAGAYAASGALTAAIAAQRTGRGEHVDVSLLECMALSLVTYPSVAASLPGGARRRTVGVMVPSVEPCKDGYVGLTTITAQQWSDFAHMIERPDLAEDESLASHVVRIRRSEELLSAIHEWTMARTADEIVEMATRFRVPAAPVGNGATVPQMAQLVERDVFVASPRGGFPQPQPPFRLRAAPRPLAPAPRVGEHDADPDLNPLGSPAVAPSTGGADSAEGLPLAGLKVLDFTSFWAGPIVTEYLASMGADVVKVESVQRPDAARFNVLVKPTEPDWYEQGYLFNALNLGKRAITLNLGDPAGRDLALRLAAGSDVVIENFTPRVMEAFRLDGDAFAQVRDDIIYVRMPGFGLEGPWRDRPGFATTMEQITGMAWVTGYRDRPPLLPNGTCDPIAGLHATFAILAALEHRRRTGQGQHIEVPMIEVAANVAEEQVAEFAAYGHLMERDENRGPLGAPQGVYACAGDESWVALAVATDEQWTALRSALGDPPWATDPGLGTAAGRRAAHDELDAGLADWAASRPPDDALAVLRAAGVPAEPVVAAYDIDRDPQMNARGFWETVEHPVVGSHRFPGWPFRLSTLRRWYSGPAPLFSQHTDEVLGGELGLTADELADLRERQVIGDRPLGL